MRCIPQLPLRLRAKGNHQVSDQVAEL